MASSSQATAPATDAPATTRRWSAAKKYGGPATADSQVISMAIHASGIPIMVDAQPNTSTMSKLLRKVRWGWLGPWLLAILLMDITFGGYGLSFHKDIWQDLPADADISIYSKGCDITTESNKYSNSRIHVEYWSTFGSASVKVDGKDVQVTAKSSKRSITWKCAITLYPNDDAGLINSLKISVDPSDATKYNTGASNVAEVMDISLDKTIIKKDLTLDVQTYSDVKVVGVQVPQMTANIVGGVFAVHEATSGTKHSPDWMKDEYKTVVHVPKSMNLKLESATVVLAAHNVDIKAQIAKDTVDDAVLAGAQVKSMGNDLYDVLRSKSSDGPYTSVTLEANDCAIYFSAMDEEHYFSSKGVDGLEVYRGETTQQGPRLLPSGVAAMKELDKYLNETSVTQKFIVYFDLSGPHVPSGTFRLLSTKSYLAFSTTIFVMMSAGMLNPEVIRITTPIVGLDFLFPRTIHEGALSEKENLQFTKGTFDALSSNCDINALNKPAATWVWDPAGPDVFVFEYEPPQKDKPASWDYRLANSSDVSMFKLCAGITALLGFLVGAVLCKMIVMKLFPYIEKQNMNMDTTASSSYQLQYQTLGYLRDWTLNSTFVAFPVPGILLRWAIRPKQKQFKVFRFRVREWPVKQHAPLLTTDASPIRLPSPTGHPDQQAFLFPQTPRPMSELNSKKKDPPAKPMFESQLAATARTVFSDASLSVGSAYQVQLQAFDTKQCTGSPIDFSNWTRPIMVKAELVFTEYPLMLFKTLLNMTPSDPFQYFLDMHCTPVKSSPSMVLTLSNMNLAVINQIGLFAGAFEFYGENVGIDSGTLKSTLQTLGSDSKKVHIVVTTGGDTQLITDTLYESCDRVPLISMGNQTRINSLKTFQEVTGQAAASSNSDQSFSKKDETTGAWAHKYYVIDFDQMSGKKQSIRLKTGQNLDQVVRFEAITGSSSQGDDTVNTAKFETTWRKLMKVAVGSTPVGSASETMFHLSDQIVLRDGLSATAFLTTDITVTNTHLSTGLPKPQHSPGFPSIFTNVFPGYTYLWGECLSLTWPFVQTSRKFRIGLVTSDLKDGQEVGEQWSTLDLTEHDVVDGKANLKVAPYCELTANQFSCHFEATDGETDEILADSSRFVVVRPITLQELELGYAAFCARNGMDLVPFGNTNDLTINNKLEFVNRTFNVIPHYRLPLPITGTGEPEADACRSWKIDEKSGPPMVENPGSTMIAGGMAVEIHHYDSYDVIESTSRKLDEEEGSDEMERVQTVVPTEASFDIPCNIFWKPGSDWSTELLLLWRLLPTFAREGYMTSLATYYGFPKIGKFIAPMDDIIRFALQMCLWWFQMLLLLGPVWVLFGVWVWHDSLMAEFDPNMGAKAESQAEESLFAFLIAPSLFKWDALDGNAKVVYTIGVLYSLGVFVLTLYGNFVHHVHTLHGFWVPFNAFITYSYLGVLFGLAFYFSMAICWILMGSLINPEELMAYALMVAGLSVLIKSNWTNLMGMKQKAEDGLASKLDIVTRALMTIFLGKAAAAKADAAVNEKSSELMAYTENVIAYLHAKETSARQLYWQCEIDLNVSAIERNTILLLRDSVGYKAFIPELLARNRVLATDFINSKYWDAAQGRANQRHTIDGTKKPPLTVMGHPVTNNEDITPLDLHQAQSVDSLIGIDPTSGEAGEIAVLAKKLGLRPATAEMVHQAFHLANNQAAAADGEIDGIVNAPLALGPIMTSVREETFFNHWLHGGITEADMTNYPNEAAMRADTTQVHNLSLSPVHRYIKAMDKEELLTLNAAVASSLTSLLDWPTIGRKCAHFANETLPHTLVIQRIERELNPVVDGSATFKVRLFAGEQAYKMFDQVYKANPTQFFIDCGIVNQECLANPKCKLVVDTAMKKHKLCDGSMDQAGLLAALDWLINPAVHGKSASSEGVMTKMYLWEGALKAILDGLGWNKDEMEPTWLHAAWMELTEGLGVYPYENATDLSILICQRLAEGGLWKSVMKTFCFEVGIGGYVCCDVDELGEQGASDKAHEIKLAGIQGKMTLDFMDTVVRWPGWVKTIWNAQSNISKFGDGTTGPRFLPVSNMDDFLEGLIYKEVDPDATLPELTSMNKYPRCPLDLQWRLSPDQTIWQVSAAGTKPLRGIWMELYIAVCGGMNCLPVDLDLYLDNLKWQLDGDSKQATPGVYTINAPALVKTGADPNSAQVGELPKGKMVSILEIQDLGDRVRARIENPDGWISLANKTTGVTFASKVPVLTFESMRTWLATEYLEAKRVVGTFAITWSQFSKLLTDYMDFHVNLTVIQQQVFLPCAKVPGDDMGELRYVHDLGAALRLWMGYGVWKGAVEQILVKMCPHGAKRDNALKLCSQEFDTLDTEGLGILQPGQLKLLLLKLLHPGLDLSEITMVVQKDLGLKIPEREVHKYFCTIDVNGDGILQASEFVSFLRVIMTEFYPEHIVAYLGFSAKNIIRILLVLVCVLSLLFVAITLVIKSFASGPVAATIHSSCSAGSSYMVKMQGDSDSGGGQAASEITIKIEAMVMTAVTGVLGLAPSVLDQLKQLMKELL